jgi:hypothetical protein
MACLNNLKQEIKTLEKLFSKSHERFQIVNASVDELTCRFISKSGKKTDIHANITVSPCLIFSSFYFLFDVPQHGKKKEKMVQWIFFISCWGNELGAEIKAKPANELYGVDDQMGKNTASGTSDLRKIPSEWKFSPPCFQSQRTAEKFID